MIRAYGVFDAAKLLAKAVSGSSLNKGFKNTFESLDELPYASRRPLRSAVQTAKKLILGPAKKPKKQIAGLSKAQQPLPAPKKPDQALSAQSNKPGPSVTLVPRASIKVGYSGGPSYKTYHTSNYHPRLSRPRLNDSCCIPCCLPPKASKPKATMSGYKKRKYSKSNVSTRVTKLERQQETGRYLSGVDAALTATPLVQHLTAVAIGNTGETRTGNWITPTYIGIRGHFLMLPAAVILFDYYRITVIQDLQTIGDTNPAYTDVFQDNSCFSFMSTTTSGRFRILYDGWYETHKQSMESAFVKIDISKKMAPVRYNGAAATDFQKGAIFMLVDCHASTDFGTYVLKWTVHWKES